MSLSILARPLTSEEQLHFQQTAIGKQTVRLGPLAIVGHADHPDVEHLKIKLMIRRVYLGDGQYLDDAIPATRSAGGRSVPKGRSINIVYSTESSFNYLQNEAEKLAIPIISSEGGLPLYYFQSIYLDAVLRCLSHADLALSNWAKDRSFLSRWFTGTGTAPLWASAESRAIQRDISEILRKQKRD